jgi:hypothetical protein
LPPFTGSERTAETRPSFITENWLLSGLARGPLSGEIVVESGREGGVIPSNSPRLQAASFVATESQSGPSVSPVGPGDVERGRPLAGDRP